MILPVKETIEIHGNYKLRLKIQTSKEKKRHWNYNDKRKEKKIICIDEFKVIFEHCLINIAP
jgi:hypothetical protein